MTRARDGEPADRRARDGVPADRGTTPRGAPPRGDGTPPGGAAFSVELVRMGRTKSTLSAGHG